MAIVKATYTQKKVSAKASIRYIAHRPGQDGQKAARTLFNHDGALGRWQAYDIIDSAEEGSHFFRIVLSPDPQAEDRRRDLHLPELTKKTMLALSEHLATPVSWVASEHTDHAPHRHIHIVAVLQRRLQVQDIQFMRQTATEACVEQRYERDLVQERRGELGRGEGWEL